MSIITIYTKSNCPNCVAAKLLLQSKGMQYEERDMDMSQIAFEFFATFPDIRQMPQIFYKGERIGGLAGLREWIKWKEEQSK
jgi:glutaredoxin 3